MASIVDQQKTILRVLIGDKVGDVLESLGLWVLVFRIDHSFDDFKVEFSLEDLTQVSHLSRMSAKPLSTGEKGVIPHWRRHEVKCISDPSIA